MVTPRLHHYRLPLKAPLYLARNITLQDRQGLILEDPERGIRSEAAPLPGFSGESLDEVIHAALAEEWQRYPSLALAYEQLSHPLPPPKAPPRSNHLWFAAKESPQHLMQRVAGEERPVVKIKPGPEPDVPSWLKLIELCPGIRFRIDPNRSWDLERCLRLAEQIPLQHIDYVEEPLPDAQKLPELFEQCPLPIALDESLLEPGWEQLAQSQQIRALVIKPTLLGPTHAAMQPTELPQILSSCFESPLGLELLERRADPSEIHGLNTAHIFATTDLTLRPVMSYKS